MRAERQQPNHAARRPGTVAMGLLGLVLGACVGAQTSADEPPRAVSGPAHVLAAASEPPSSTAAGEELLEGECAEDELAEESASHERELKHLLQQYRYGLVSHMTHSREGVFLLPLPETIDDVEKCFDEDRGAEPYSKPLSAKALLGGPCDMEGQALLRLLGEPLTILDAAETATSGKIVSVDLDPEVSGFRYYEIEEGSLSVAEAYQDWGGVLAVTFQVPAGRGGDAVLAVLGDSPKKLGEADAVGEAEPSEDRFESFLERAHASYGVALKAQGVDPDAVNDASVFETGGDLLFFGDVEIGDPPCGDDESFYAQVSVALFDSGAGLKEIDLCSSGCPNLRWQPELAWVDETTGASLLLFRERYSERPQILEYQDGRLLPYLLLASTHPMNHPC